MRCFLCTKKKTQNTFNPASSLTTTIDCKPVYSTKADKLSDSGAVSACQRNAQKAVIKWSSSRGFWFFTQCAGRTQGQKFHPKVSARTHVLWPTILTLYHWAVHAGSSSPMALRSICRIGLHMNRQNACRAQDHPWMHTTLLPIVRHTNETGTYGASHQKSTH